MQLIRHLVAISPDATDSRTPAGAARISLKSLALRYVEPDDGMAQLDDLIAGVLSDAAPCSSSASASA